MRLRMLRFLLPGLLSGTISFGQPSLNPTDTSYVNELLRKAESIETYRTTDALGYYRKAHVFSQKIGYVKGYFESVRLLAYLLNTLGRHDEAKRVATEALRKARQDTSAYYRSVGHFALAQTAMMQGRHTEAIPQFEQAARYMLSQKNRKKAAVVYQNLGLIYTEEKLYPQALDYFNRALRYDLAEPVNRQDLAMDYFSMAVVYTKQNQLKKAMAFFRKARGFMDPAKDLSLLASVYSNMGNVFEVEARYDSALYYEREALRLSRQLNNPRMELHQLAVMAETYNVLGRYSEAKSLLDRSYKMATEAKVGLSEFRNIYREYVNATVGLGNYKAAIPWFTKYLETKDSLGTMEAKELLQNYEVKLKQAEAGQKLAEKQRQITQLEADRKRQNLWLLIAVLATVAVAGGAGFGYLYYRQRQRTARREQELAVVQSELAGQQKERLRISKEMHDDLGASLTAIGLLSEVVKTRMGAATTPEVGKISEISAEMVTSMNEIIWSLNTKNDNLNGLIAYTRSYASEFIDNTPLTLRTDVEESPHEISIRGVDRRNVFLAVKEALNNVVKHAQATEITLVIQPEADHLRIEVIDNGRGFVPTERASLRNGLSNMCNRMAESGGTCAISSSPAGTTVKITYPYVPVPAGKIMQM